MILIKTIRYLLNFCDIYQQKKFINYIKSKFKEPITIFDVGAHYGETIELFQKKIHCKKIYSFEASSSNFKKLENNFKNNYSSNIEIFNYAIGEKEKETYINQTIESSSSTINEINLNSKYLKRKLEVLKIKKNNLIQKKIPIKVITLDKFISDKNIRYIDLLKIDTEGYEYNVLRGLSNHHDKIKLIYFEHHYDDMILKNYKFQDIHSLLTDYKFKKVSKSKMFFRKSFEYIYENQR